MVPRYLKSCVHLVWNLQRREPQIESVALGFYIHIEDIKYWRQIKKLKLKRGFERKLSLTWAVFWIPHPQGRDGVRAHPPSFKTRVSASTGPLGESGKGPLKLGWLIGLALPSAQESWQQKQPGELPMAGRRERPKHWISLPPRVCQVKDLYISWRPDMDHVGESRPRGTEILPKKPTGEG